MSHVLFAVFDDSGEVGPTIAELGRLEAADLQSTVIAHPGALGRLPASELALCETGAAAMTARMLAVGLGLGVMVGLAASVLGFTAAGPFAPLLLTTMAGGIGGLFAGIAGGGSVPDPTLSRLSEGLAPGKVLLSVEAFTLDAAERAVHVLHRHHGRVVHRHLVGSLTQDEDLELNRPTCP